MSGLRLTGAVRIEPGRAMGLSAIVLEPSAAGLFEPGCVRDARGELAARYFWRIVEKALCSEHDRDVI